MIGGRGDEGNPMKIPISNPHYGTFAQPQPQPQPQPYPPPPPPPYLYPSASAPPLPPPQQPPSPTCHHTIPIGYQSLPYPCVVQQGIPIREPKLPFCGIGVGWALFVAGFFFAAIPWYVGVFILLFVIQDYREKPGLIACTVAAALVTVPAILKPLQVW